MYVDTHYGVIIRERHYFCDICKGPFINYKISLGGPGEQDMPVLLTCGEGVSANGNINNF